MNSKKSTFVCPHCLYIHVENFYTCEVGTLIGELPKEISDVAIHGQFFVKKKGYNFPCGIHGDSLGGVHIRFDNAYINKTFVTEVDNCSLYAYFVSLTPFDHRLDTLTPEAIDALIANFKNPNGESIQNVINGTNRKYTKFDYLRCIQDRILPEITESEIENECKKRWEEKQSSMDSYTLLQIEEATKRYHENWKFQTVIDAIKSLAYHVISPRLFIDFIQKLKEYYGIELKTSTKELLLAVEKYTIE
jgi:hypothetical protein